MMDSQGAKWRSEYDVAELNRLLQPQICTGGDLEPARQFAHPCLVARPDNITDALADVRVEGVIGKACAGLRHEYRAQGHEVREAFGSGVFLDRVAHCLRWAIPGMRDTQVASLMSVCGLSISEIAAGFRWLFGDSAYGYANYINRWTQDPANPSLHADVWLHLSNAELLGGHAPSAIYTVRKGDPKWTNDPSADAVIIDLGNLHYFFAVDVLQEAHRLWDAGEIDFPSGQPCTAGYLPMGDGS